jgi:predicted RNA-binding Zn ribbon-like protein
LNIVAHEFAPHDIVGGHLALDFVNTVTARDAQTPLDWLDGYRRLIQWAALTNAFEAADLAKLRELAGNSPQRAAAALARARRVREALHDAFAALIGRNAVPAHALEEVEAAWRKAIDRARLAPVTHQIEPALDVARSSLDFIVDTIALEAVALMRDFPESRARVCLGEQCGWLFHDTSKGGKRVWCDMATCGNTAKSRRFQARKGRERRLPLA